jgi:hypothetical protein
VHRRNTEQPEWIPKLTKLGYKKMKMPKGLLQVGNRNKSKVGHGV